MAGYIDKIVKTITPKDTLGFSWLYFLATLSWLIVVGTMAMNMRTYLVFPHESPGIGVEYFTVLTLHGMSAIFGVIFNGALAIMLFSMYTSKLSIVHRKALLAFFWIANLGLALAEIGLPDMGWYMFPPLAIEDNAVFHAFNLYRGAAMGAGYLFLALNSGATAAAALTLVIDGYISKKQDGAKINIFAKYGIAFAFVMGVTIPALTATELWFAAAIWFPSVVKVDPLLNLVLFWFFGHPVVYYVPFPLFGSWYYFIPKYANRPIFSPRWSEWNIWILSVASMIIFLHHLQTFPFPVAVRAWITIGTLALAVGSGITTMNVGLTILLSKNYNWRDPAGFAFLISLIGFILAGTQALPLPINLTNIYLHNSYWVVGHFHLVIWTLILVGTSAVFTELLRASLPGFDFSEKARKLMTIGLLEWTIPFVTIGYLFTIIGFFGMLRREIAYPAQFAPYQFAISYLAEIGIPGLVMTIAVALGEYIRASVKGGVAGFTPSTPGSPSFTLSTNQKLIKAEGAKGTEEKSGNIVKGGVAGFTPSTPGSPSFTLSTNQKLVQKLAKIEEIKVEEKKKLK